jgi:hypothetical protein
MTRPKENKAKSDRKRGGQAGHAKGKPFLYEPEECQEVHDHKPNVCSCCGESLRGEDPTPHRYQQIEIPMIKPIVIEHRVHELECEHCGEKTRAPLPEECQGSRYGERLGIVVSLLSGSYRQSHRNTVRLRVKQPRQWRNSTAVVEFHVHYV